MKIDPEMAECKQLHFTAQGALMLVVSHCTVQRWQQARLATLEISCVWHGKTIQFRIQFLIHDTGFISAYCISFLHTRRIAGKKTVVLLTLTGILRRAQTEFNRSAATLRCQCSLAKSGDLFVIVDPSDWKRLKEEEENSKRNSSLTNVTLRGAMGEISNFYNLSARLLIFNTYIPPIINTHTSKFRSCLSNSFFNYNFILFGKRTYFQNLSPQTNLKCMIQKFVYNISDTFREKINIRN